jgi:hypothetical protein
MRERGKETIPFILAPPPPSHPLAPLSITLSIMLIAKYEEESDNDYKFCSSIVNSLKGISLIQIKCTEHLLPSRCCARC